MQQENSVYMALQTNTKIDYTEINTNHTGLLNFS